MAVSKPKRPQRPPAGLSKWARGVWTTLLRDNDFSDSEIVAFTRALRWWDLSDSLLAEANAAQGGARAQMTKLSLDAATSALRHWKVLKFTDPANPSRRPGRPGGVDWSSGRKAGHAAHMQALRRG
jgi:hypothetical protein